jgi:indole-3-glycerol phosphate synthase
MVLEDIVQRQRETLALQRPDGYEAGLRTQSAALPKRDFKAAIMAGPTPALIAECKRRSPVRGILQARFTS